MNDPVIYLYAPERNFLAPYFEREFDNYIVVTEAPNTKIEGAVMVSSANPTTDWQKREQAFAEMCLQKQVEPCILRVPDVVATGMTGLPMRLARGIARGTLMHIKGNEAVISLIHGVDVAQYGKALIGKKVCVNITDGTQTTIDQLIDALAYRLKDKMIFSLAPRWARLLYGKEFYTQMTTSNIIDDKEARALVPDIVLHPVTEYLTTHVYDDESL